jgi:hypothetical protein
MLDHLVFGVPDLDQGIALIERQTGVRPAFGGRHPGRGTHNALMALGGRQYLEIIAIDPSQTNAPGLLFPELRTLSEPAFVSWAIAVPDIAGAMQKARAAGYETVGPLEGSRARSDGSLLEWKTLRIARPATELLPFFIAWGSDAAHPSQDSPSGCRLASVTLEHPDPAAMSKALQALGAEATVTAGPRVRLRARLDAPKGPVELG